MNKLTVLVSVWLLNFDDFMLSKFIVVGTNRVYHHCMWSSMFPKSWNDISIVLLLGLEKSHKLIFLKCHGNYYSLLAFFLVILSSKVLLGLESTLCNYVLYKMIFKKLWPPVIFTNDWKSLKGYGNSLVGKYGTVNVVCNVFYFTLCKVHGFQGWVHLICWYWSYFYFFFNLKYDIVWFDTISDVQKNMWELGSV